MSPTDALLCVHANTKVLAAMYEIMDAEVPAALQRECLRMLCVAIIGAHCETSGEPIDGVMAEHAEGRS